MSFHGIPQRYHRNGDPYPLQCEATARLLAERLQLAEGQWQLTYQSRFGREPWLEPYTDETLAALPGQGVRHVQVVCPGFAADCLETLEEIDVENRGVFLDAGGELFSYIPALNGSGRHARALTEVLLEHAGGWPAFGASAAARESV